MACVDIDECATNSNICDANAECFNKLGGYECRCNAGFRGNGFTCYPENSNIETTEDTTPFSPTECRNGFYYDETNRACADIDECAQDPNICGENADCVNRLGSYECTASSSTYEATPSIPGLAPEHWLCDACSEHADCNQGVCVCRNGWNGDGIECVYNCQDDSVWDIDRCIPIPANSEEDEG